MKKSFNLENLIYLTVFGLPFYLIRFNFFGISTNILDILEILVFLWWVFSKSYKKPSAQEIFREYKKYLIAIGLIFLGLAVSTLAGGEYKMGLGIIKSWFVLPILFLFSMINILDHEKTKNVFRAFFWAAFGVAIFAIIYFFLGLFTYDSRLEGFFNSPNYLAMYLAPAVIVGLIFFKENKKIYAPSILVILSALYLTFSYGAWLALTIALLVTVLINKNFSRKALVSIVVVMGIFLFSQLGTSKWNDLASLKERSSLSSRFMIWKSAVKIVGDNVLLGIGPGNFQNKYLEYQKFFPPYLEWAVPHPHNLYLAFWLGAGLSGLVGFILLLIFWFRDFFKTEKSDLEIVALGIMIYILVHGLVDTTYFKNDLAVIFWLNFLMLKQKKL